MRWMAVVFCGEHNGIGLLEPPRATIADAAKGLRGMDFGQISPVRRTTFSETAKGEDIRKNSL